MRLRRVAFVLLLGALAPPASATATARTRSFRVGPVTVGGVEVKQEQARGGLPKARSDAYSGSPRRGPTTCSAPCTPCR